MNSVYIGITVIKKYMTEKESDKQYFTAEHDQIWCSEYNRDDMSFGDRSLMDALGWFEDVGAWSKRV